MKHQTRADRLDESLGERRGKESTKKQSYADRRHESEGAKHSHHKKMHDHHMKEAKKHAHHLHKLAHHHQTRSDRMDESLGMRRGKESTKTQSYASRRHESEGARKK